MIKLHYGLDKYYTAHTLNRGVIKKMEIQYIESINEIISEVKKAVIGKDDIVKKVLIAIIAGGHVLLEDIPGVGKTTMAMAFSRATGLNYNRVQFTPDVMPGDITGFTIYKKETNSLDMVTGAIMCNLFLADEINRTSSKTQAALLEAMEEGKVTIDTQAYALPMPFTVIATQNPIGHAGTQLLPESQLDRFLMRLSMGYPSRINELSILRSKSNGNPLRSVSAVTNAGGIMRLKEAADSIYVHDSIYEYIVDLIQKTRSHPMLELGASPRGTIALTNVSRVNAFVQGRDYVLPSDVQESFIDVISHRIKLTSKAVVQAVTTKELLNEILRKTHAPNIRENH